MKEMDAFKNYYSYAMWAETYTNWHLALFSLNIFSTDYEIIKYECFPRVSFINEYFNLWLCPFNQIFPTPALIIKRRLLIVQTPYIEIITKCNWYAPKLAIK